MTVTKQIKLLTILTLAAISAVSLHAQVQTNTPPATLPPAPPKVPWKGSASLGVTLTRGNSDTLLATAGAVAGKKWAHDELSLGTDGTYGESKVGSNTTVKTVASCRTG